MRGASAEAGDDTAIMAELEAASRAIDAQMTRVFEKDEELPEPVDPLAIEHEQRERAYQYEPA